MWNPFKKKNYYQKILSENEFNKAIEILSDPINESLQDTNEAYKFVLQELDGASHGNEHSQQFVRDSGIPTEEYRGALNIYKSSHAQEHLNEICMGLFSDQNLMVKVRVAITDQVMMFYRLGKYRHLQLQDTIDELMFLLSINDIDSSLSPLEAYSQFLSNEEYNANPCPFTTAFEKSKSINVKLNLEKKHIEQMATTEESLLFMANAYVQRLCSYLGMLYGSILEPVSNQYTDLFFKFAQHSTNPDPEFQKYAAVMAYSFMETSIPLLNIDGVRKFLECYLPNENEIRLPVQDYNYIDLETLFKFFSDLSQRDRIAKLDLINFISSHSKPNINLRQSVFGEHE